MPPIVLVDTSVFLNVLNVPGFSQDRDTVLDLSIIKAWEQTCTQLPTRRVEIWALDQHLTGYDRIP